MTCQERVDLMQRYLDHDLNGEEEQELLLHLQQCDECARLFDRLRRLDQELAQLPKVVPATSLVDAILPQLAELDRLPAALEETAAQEPSIVASGGIPRTRRSFFSWRLAGGTAVAAALIGLFVMKEQNLLPLPSSLASNHSASTAGGAVADRAKFSAAATASAPPASQESASTGSAASSSAAAAPKQAAPAGAAVQAAPAAKAQAPNAAAAGSAPAAKPEQVQRDTAANDSTNRVQISSPAGSSSEAANAEGTAVRNNAPMAPAASPQPEQKVDSSAPAADLAATGTVANGGTGQPGLTAPQAKNAPAPDPVPEARPFASLLAPPAPAPVTMQSPDGKWIAAVENVKVVVRQADTGVTVRTSTYSWKTMDVITLTGFTADGKLSYRVQHPSGADDVVLDMATGVETKTAVPPAAK